MAVDRGHLRHLSRTLYGSCAGATAAAVGAVVPTGKRRYIHYVKVWQNGVGGNGTPHIVVILNAGTSNAMDCFCLAGSGLSTYDFEDIGEPLAQETFNVDTPVYVLESGQQLGISSLSDPTPPDNSYILVNYYDEP
jgi:hypothetical protein